MSFRRRLILLAAAAVASAVVLGSIATYVIVRADLRSGVDHQLARLAVAVTVRSSPTEQRVHAGRGGLAVDDSGDRLARA